MKRPELSILVILAATIIFGYQNCSNGTRFESGGALGAKAGAAPGGGDGGPTGDRTPPNQGDGSPVNPGTSIGMLPPYGTDNDNDTPIDTGYDGKKIIFSCATGATSKMLPEDALKSANDLFLSNVQNRTIAHSEALRNVNLSNIHGSVAILNAYRIQGLSNINDSPGGGSGSEVAYIRAMDLVDASNVHGSVGATLAAVTMGSVSNIHGGSVCASAREFQSFSNVQAAFVKIRGREDGSSTENAKADSISNVHSIFTSIYRVNARSMSNLVNQGGELFIRDSVIEELSNIHGGLTLINTRVKKLSNGSGVLRMLNSKIDSESNTQYRTENLVTAK